MNLTKPHPIETRRSELEARFGHKRLGREPPTLSREQIQQRDEIINLNPQNVLVICDAGVYRSGLVKNLLEKHGYTAHNIGTGGANPFKPENIDITFDVIIFMTETVKEKFETRLKDLELQEKVVGVPTRVLSLAENSALHGGDTERLGKYTEYVEKKLDNLGFVGR